MKITIAKVNRQLREGISKKTGKAYSFESLGIAPLEDTLTDINGTEFDKDDRWLNGISVAGVTDGWDEGDVVNLLVIKKVVKARDGSDKEVVNFKLPEGIEVMVRKGKPTPAPKEGAGDFGDDEEVDLDDF